MFLGTIEPEIRSIVNEHTRNWETNEYWIGCSGNMTIERFLHAPGVKLHSNDVSVYTTALGNYLSGQPVELALKDESADALSWLEPYLVDDADKLATMMLGTRFLDMVGKTGKYYERMMDGTKRQFPEMHATTKAKIEGLSFRVESYHSMDVREWMRNVVPENGAVISFPPFDVGGYESMWAPIEKHFNWPEPSYSILDEDGIKDTLALIMQRDDWIFASNIRHDDWEQHLCGIVQTSPRRRPNYVYASSKRTRIVRPREQTMPVLNPRLRKGDVIGDEIKLAPLKLQQFNSLRSQYLNPKIRTSAPSCAFALLSEGRVLGAFAFSPSTWSPDEMYMMSDFPVSNTDYPRLSKLLVLAACSKETKHLLQNVTSKRMASLTTTAFTQKPVSMKYRGILDLSKRSDSKDPEFEFELKYDGELGRWTLAEALTMWKKKWGQTREDTH